MIPPNFPGVCYSYDMIRKKYDTNTNANNFQWDWNSNKVKIYNTNRRTETFRNTDVDGTWEIIGFMGTNVLFNEDGIVFSAPFARSNPIHYGGESGTIILKKERPDEFIIANGKWKKDSTDFLQNLAGSAIAKGTFYGTTEPG